MHRHLRQDRPGALARRRPTEPSHHLPSRWPGEAGKLSRPADGLPHRRRADPGQRVSLGKDRRRADARADARDGRPLGDRLRRLPGADHGEHGADGHRGDGPLSSRRFDHTGQRHGEAPAGQGDGFPHRPAGEGRASLRRPGHGRSDRGRGATDHGARRRHQRHPAPAVAGQVDAARRSTSTPSTA